MTDNINEPTTRQKSGSRKTLIILLIIGSVLCVFAGAGIAYYFVGRPLVTPKTTVIFEPDLARMPSPASHADLVETARVLSQRFKSLGLGNLWTSFEITDNGQIMVHIPTSVDIGVIDRIKVPGLIEFVDFGKTPVAVGTKVITDFNKSPQNLDGTEWHTVMSGAVIKESTVGINQNEGYQIEFDLTDKGKKIFADHTSQNINSYLGITIDKEVIVCPQIMSPILDGRGVIDGSFTLQNAQSLAAVMGFGALPIPLK